LIYTRACTALEDQEKPTITSDPAKFKPQLQSLLEEGAEGRDTGLF
jgi:hypothetical protein